MRRFAWQLFTRIVLLQLVLVILAASASVFTAQRLFRRQFVAQVESQLHDTLQTVRLGTILTPNWCAEHAANTSFRFTVVAVDGELICDSHSTDATTFTENLLEQPEIQQALGKGFGVSQRTHSGTGEDYVFAAMTWPATDTVVRAAFPLSKLDVKVQMIDTTIVSFLLVIAAALVVFAIWSGRMLVFPISRLISKTQGVLKGAQAMTSTESLHEDSFGEWSELESSIDDIRRDLLEKAESLSDEREELAALMSAVSDAILAVDAEGRPLFFNSRFALLFGNQEVLRERGVRLWEMFRAPEILEAFKVALTQGQSGEAKAVSFEREGESKRFYVVSVSPLRKQDGKTYGAMGIFHDVTELKSAEQIRIDFVANVSHELRTPLTSIKGYTDTLLADVQEGRAVSKDFLDVISRNVDRLMALIRDLLDLSSLESTDVLHKAPVNTQEITSRILGQLQGRFTSKNQTVNTRFDAPIVMADARRLEQVLTNLLENAHKYTPAGGVIQVSWESDQNAVRLRVSDNGPGIPLEHHARLFERFYRVDKARSRDQGGTGLGLAIVKHIMQRHDGSIWVESQMGQGSSFFCRFPL